MSKRVLFITPSLFKGGAETQLLKVATFLKSQHKEVMIISLKPINSFEHELQQEGIRVVSLKNWLACYFSNCLKMIKTVREFKPDVVVGFMFIAIIFARLLKIWFRFKLISTIRISVIHNKWYFPFKITSVLDDIVVYNSNASKISFQKYNFAKKKDLVINNSISIPIPVQQTAGRNQDKPFVWVCIAHFKYNKDYLTLFKAMALLKDINIVNMRLEIIGNLHGASWPLEIIQKYQLAPQVSLIGQQHNPSEYLGQSDAFVLSSFSEGMPNALLEAMANGKSVVVSDIPCNMELINAANCGFLFEQGNEFDLAIKMREMMALTQHERNALGQKGRAYISDNFSEEKVMKEWLQAVDSFSQVPIAG